MNYTLPRSAYLVLYSVLGPRQAGRVRASIEKWINSSGLLWTIKRLKAYFNAAKAVRGGNNKVAILIYQDNSISYGKNDLLPKGSFKPIAYKFVNGQRFSVIRGAAACFRVYTSIVLPELVSTKVESAHESIMRPLTDSQESFIENLSYIFSDWVQINRHLFPKQVGRPNLAKLKAYSSTFSPVWNSNGNSIPYGRCAQSLVSATYLPYSLRGDNPAEEMREVFEITAPDTDSTGRLHFLLEKGGKVRTIAVPNAWVQWAFQPLHDFLDSAIQKHGSSVVHDQANSAYFIKRKLEENNRLFCYDLSSATDRFPFKWQQQILDSLGLESFSDAFEEIKYNWLVSEEVEGETFDEYWDYIVGQPMGIYGSFPLFHLAHAALLDTLCNEHDCSPRDTYRVLGDDVVICDSMVAKDYQRVMNAAGVPISETKSIISDRLAEFAGFLGVKTNRTTDLFRPYKHSTGRHHSSILNLLWNIGRIGARRLGVRYEDTATLLKNTKDQRHPDLSPIVPRDVENPLRAPILSPSRLQSILTSCYNDVIPEFERIRVPGGSDDPDLMDRCCRYLLDFTSEDISHKEPSVLDDNILGLSTPEKVSRPEKDSIQRQIESDPLIQNDKKAEEETESKDDEDSSDDGTSLKKSSLF